MDIEKPKIKRKRKRKTLNISEMVYRVTEERKNEKKGGDFQVPSDNIVLHKRPDDDYESEEEEEGEWELCDEPDCFNELVNTPRIILLDEKSLKNSTGGSKYVPKSAVTEQFYSDLEKEMKEVSNEKSLYDFAMVYSACKWDKEKVTKRYKEYEMDPLQSPLLPKGATCVKFTEVKERDVVCDFCGDDESGTFGCSQCKGKFCRLCITEEIDLEGSTLLVGCPNRKCSYWVDGRSVERVVGRSGSMNFYEECILTNFLRHSPTSHECEICNLCVYQGLGISGAAGGESSSTPKIECENCAGITCGECESVAHDPITCEQWTAWQGHLNERVLKFVTGDGLKKCPVETCAAKVFNVGGPKHVKCPVCKTRFCWMCRTTEKEKGGQDGGSICACAHEMNHEVYIEGTENERKFVNKWLKMLEFLFRVKREMAEITSESEALWKVYLKSTFLNIKDLSFCVIAEFFHSFYTQKNEAFTQLFTVVEKEVKLIYYCIVKELQKNAPEVNFSASRNIYQFASLVTRKVNHLAELVAMITGQNQCSVAPIDHRLLHVDPRMFSLNFFPAKLTGNFSPSEIKDAAIRSCESTKTNSSITTGERKMMEAAEEESIKEKELDDLVKEFGNSVQGDYDFGGKIDSYLLVLKKLLKGGYDFDFEKVEQYEKFVEKATTELKTDVVLLFSEFESVF